MKAQIPDLSVFLADCSPMMKHILDFEDLRGSELIDYLLVLEVVTPNLVQRVLGEAGIPFFELKVDTTPDDLRAIADKHNIIIERGKSNVIYIPLGCNLDQAMLEIDIPNVELVYRFISDYNYQLLRTGASTKYVPANMVRQRPLLIFRRIILDCIDSGSTDVHFVPYFQNKVARCKIEHRINKEVCDAHFQLDANATQALLRAVVSKLTTVPAAELDQPSGMGTKISNVFGDGNVDLRFTGSRTAAGYYIVISVQTVATTTLSIEELGFPEGDCEALHLLAKLRTGLTLVTGEMRSGKNTTIFSMIKDIEKDPIRIVEFSDPIENLMAHVQIDYQGDLDVLQALLKRAKKEDIDVAVLNEIPSSDVAKAVRDLVNSSVGVYTTTHLSRVWFIINKLCEFFGDDYKSIISQLNAVVNQRMFRAWEGPNLRKCILDPESSKFARFAYQYGVRQYFVPENMADMKFRLQPMLEYIVLDDSMRSSILNLERTDTARAEVMIRTRVTENAGRLEHKVAAYINNGRFALQEMQRLWGGA